ncbi:MAG TPA: glycosyltransferase family 9 protein [Candidatus Hydrogenedentes bacterium]|nr:glycosyltransferase family 9 protein [Candidatus Hydrogenedentota bacterium]HOL76812.1 glycosyltransferase family 9 protein [Candidatus Hydrogenedentota bacterium]HPO86246.1 glycosyltransferase family 9 protein [Candidatus Hydrogenedentota bacterium]
MTKQVHGEREEVISKRGEPLKILIIRLSAIGDVVRALMILHILRGAFPDARLDWVVEPKSAAVVEGHPYLSELLVFERGRGVWGSLKSFFELCRRIRANRYDIVVDAHGILKSGLMTLFSGAPVRVGFARPRSQEGSYFFTNRKVRLPHQGLNRVEENLALCGALVDNPKWTGVTIFVPWETQHRVDRFFDETFDGGKAVVAVHPAVERVEKQWPVEHFARACDLLLADGRFDVLLTWGPGQKAVVEQVADAMRRKPVIAPEMPDVKHYAWLVHRSSLYLGGDTGPMHIAAAMGTPAVAIFGGTDPAKHTPYGAPSETLYVSDKGLSAKERLRRVSPEAAYDACVRLFQATRALNGYYG